MWIEDAQEFAKFVSAVNTYGVERDGEGITYTDNHFYAYYISIDGEPIPYVDVYLNAEDSQQIIVEVNQTIQQNGRQRPARNRDYIDRAYEFVGYTKNKNHNNDGSDKSLQDSLGSNFLGGNIPRAGRYYDSPNLYVKGQRINRSIYREGVIIDLPPQENGELFRPGDAEDVIKKTKNPEFQIVFHGSGAKFDAFDHLHMGEGNQAYGWGTYVTESESIGRANHRPRIVGHGTRY